MAIDTDATDLGHLDPAIGKVEFKLTVHAGEEDRVEALLRREAVQPQRRKVYFYDTKDLKLSQHHLVLRARVTDGDDDDSTVKLRPADLTDPGAPWRQIDGIKIELDVVGAKQVLSAKLEGKPDGGEIEQVAAKQRPLGSLFSSKQEQLIADRAPQGITVNDLEVLGPVDARKWDLDHPDGFAYPLSVEEWSLPDATRFIELSFKVPADEASGAQAAFDDFLTALPLKLPGDTTQKTPRVLKFFADRL